MEKQLESKILKLKRIVKNATHFATCIPWLGSCSMAGDVCYRLMPTGLLAGGYYFLESLRVLELEAEYLHINHQISNKLT